ncbi:MAG TPA: CHASE4 domain-containing protein, partial [Fibrobacteria bacterium]|nr:CHASE4 domain-containing protein [Fibrobacteria bacterium]
MLTVLLALDMLSLLGPSYKELDRRFASRERIRMEQHFVARLDNLKASARDWGVWDGMAQWVKDRNSAFARENLQLANLVNAGFARLSVFDTSGGVLISIADGEVPAAIDKWAAREASHWAVRRDTTVVAGMTVQKGRIWSIVLQPVRSGSWVEPPRALLMLASPAGVGNVNDGVVRFHSAAMESIADTDSLVLHGQLPGLEGLPIAQFTLKVDRVVWSGGQRTLLYLGIGAILFALAFVAIVYRFLDRTLLRRLHLLRLDLETIRSFPTRGSRIRSLGEDEIGQVGSQVNATFDALEESQKHLADAQRIARLGFWQLDLETFKAQISSEHVETAGLEVDARNFEITFDDYLDRYVHPDDRDRLRAWAEFAKTRETEEVSRDLEYRTIGPEGEVRHLAAACRKRSGEERILFLVAQDVTDRRRMEEEILRGNLYD